MNEAKCDLSLYVRFLLVSSKRFSGTELSRIAPEPISHDAVSHFLSREEFSPKDLWKQVRPLTRPGGVLILDDTVFPKPWSRENPLIHRQWCGALHRPVFGIGLITLLWTGTGEHLPMDFRVYAKRLDGKSRLDHATEMLNSAKERGLTPSHVLMDAVYTKLSVLKQIRTLGWHWVATLKKNRIVDHGVQLSTLDIPPQGRQVHLRGFGPIMVFQSARTPTSVKYFGTDDLTLTKDTAESLFGARWAIEEFHRGLKQTTGAGDSSARLPARQRTHLGAALVAFLTLERFRRPTGTPWTEAKTQLTRWALTELLRSGAPPLNTA